MAKINKELYNSTHDVNYVYPSVSLAELGQKVLELRKIQITLSLVML